MMRRVWIAAVAALVLSGCGATGMPLAASSAMGAMQAASATKKPAAKNPFLGLTVTVEPLALLCPCVSITATNDAKLKVAVSTEDGAVDTVAVNRSTLVKGGKLMLTKNTQPSGLLLLDEADDEAGMSAMSATDKTARRRASFLAILDKLADGLKAAKIKKGASGSTNKEDAKTVGEVVDALKAFVKDERAKDEEPKGAVLE